MKKLLLAASLLFTVFAHAQEDDLLSQLDSTQVQDTYATATFKGLQIVTLQSTKLPAAKEFYFVVSHRFGTVKNGIDEFFGLDAATTKLGGVYGITNWLSVSASRHTLLKMYETSLKYRLVRQSENFPVDIVGYNTIDINSFLKKDDYPKIEFADRLAFVNQLLISRKFSDKLSLELAPTFIHKNLYTPATENDDQFALAAGGRMKLTKRLSLNLEYAYNFDKPDFYNNPLSVGLDVETGGHIFQLIFTSSQAMTESGYITNAAGDWGDGDFFFGFNLYRVF
ncbi:DUF5777 family beta-barrel protein [Flavobacterium subsaxonicum]|uniref:DUF5777 domain-containing protein n=1 Tax=Flavobacterium subsaxonicum WB 4.1-42 = DSM 21790 TaxID=1121898 RepID=A0A0A2MKX5_9FLAO|nr:DUF5777 family beta-barrel protein [Flavobacterium subsaxonicum]KGO92201.1 hypothetical protein Q766_13645 [Flavobacterium subsaxonicum WB 4.1-42 = DSM 21790]